MYDAYIEYSGKISDPFILHTLDGENVEIPEKYFYLTCHREENTSDNVLKEIFEAMQSLPYPTIYPVHPRNKKRAQEIKEIYGYNQLILTEPVGYLESIYLVNHAEKIVTDSGGLQREAFFAKKKCVTILNFVCWPETMVGDRNNLSAPQTHKILAELGKEQSVDAKYQPFGDGHSAKKIVEMLERTVNK